MTISCYCIVLFIQKWKWFDEYFQCDYKAAVVFDLHFRLQYYSDGMQTLFPFGNANLSWINMHWKAWLDREAQQLSASVRPSAGACCRGYRGVTCYTELILIGCGCRNVPPQTLGIVGNISPHMCVREDGSLSKSSFDIRLQKSQCIHQLCTASNMPCWMPVCLDMVKKYLIYSLCSFSIT